MTRAKLIECVKGIKVIGRGRVFPDDVKKDVVRYYFKEGEMNDKQLLRDLNLFPATVFKWRIEFKVNVKKTTARPLKANSSSGKGRTVGTTLSTILRNISEKDVLAQIEMIDILKESGFKQEALIQHLTTPSREEFEHIMHAVQLLSKNYELKLKET